MIRLRDLIAAHILALPYLALRVHHGMSIEGAIKVGLLAAIVVDGAVGLKWLRTGGRPKTLPSGRFPWRQWGTGHAVAIGIMFLIALQGYGAADLIFLAICAFGGGNLLTVAFWLWDRHTLRREG